MSGRPQDAFMEDSEDSCPLCVEEFDLSDKNFRPCPCGYQICQFCYNNIKTNMNGLCPACRRPYDDKNIEWKIISPEEFKADVANQARKKAAARQKEAERRQVETLNRKHLQGLRVVQRNLVYITGMSSEGVSDESLEEQLKSQAVFGQYGRIIKLSANKLKDTGPGSALAIFITFADEEAASRCIAALDGRAHQGRILKAQHGTTKYCSAFLRNETCNNRNCTFLHETGEDRDSFSRQELSSLNAASSQTRPPQGAAVPTYRQQTPQAPPGIAGPSTQTPVMNRSEAMSRSDSGDGPALPSTANWAKNPQLQQSRRSSLAASRATPSPKTTHAKTVLTRPASRTSSKATGTATGKEREISREATTAQSVTRASKKKPQTASANQKSDESLSELTKALENFVNFKWEWSLDKESLDEDTLRQIETHPPLIDPHGGAKRAALRQRQERMRQKQEEARSVAQTTAAHDDDDNRLGGSLQLGGEPDVGEDGLESSRNRGGASIFSHQPFDTNSGNTPPFGQSALTNDFSSIDNVGRGTQQRGGVSLLKNNQDNDAILQQFQRAPTTSQHHSTLSNPFQGHNPVLSGHSRHGRQSSRFTFANDASSATASVKSTVNPLLQQSSLLSGQSKQFTGQPNMQTGFYSGVQGPPPGLKSSGTPPISGGGMFGQGHGFASAMGGNVGFGGALHGKGGENEALLMRGRAGTGGLGPDAGKHPAQAATYIDHLNLLDRGSPRPIDRSRPRFEHTGRSQTTTPSIPPGFGASEFPPLASLKAKESSSSPVVATEQPVAISKPAQSTPNRKGKQKEALSPIEDEAASPTVAPVEPTIEVKNGQATASPSKKSESKRTKKAVEAAAATEPDTVEGSKTTNTADTETKDSPDNRHKPGKLDIAAAQDAARELFNDQEMAKKKQKSAANDVVDKKEAVKDTASIGTGPSRVGTPATGADTPASAAPITRAPRTLRVIDTPKTENAPKPTVAKATVEPSPASVSATAAKAASRRPSFSSINVPSTPSNEVHSETASYTDSRPASPTGSKTALPTRVKTKSQAKKERRTRKANEESKLSASITADVPEPEVVQEAIVGRKKKAKKEKPVAVKPNTKASEKTPADAKKETIAKPEPQPIQEKAASSAPIAEPDKPSAKPKKPLTTKERIDRMSFPDLLQWYSRQFPHANQAAELLTTPPSWKTSTNAVPTTVPPLTANELEALECGKPVLVDSVPIKQQDPESMQKNPYPYSLVLPNANRTVFPMVSRAEGELYVHVYNQLLSTTETAARAMLGPTAGQESEIIRTLLGPVNDVFASLYDIHPELSQTAAVTNRRGAGGSRVNDAIKHDATARRWMNETIREIAHHEALAGGDYFTRRRAATLGHGPVSLDAVPAAGTPAEITAAAARIMGSAVSSAAAAATTHASSSGSAVRRSPVSTTSRKQGSSSRNTTISELEAIFNHADLRLNTPLENRDLLADLPPPPFGMAEIDRMLAGSKEFIELMKKDEEQMDKKMLALMRKNAKLWKKAGINVSPVGGNNN